MSNPDPCKMPGEKPKVPSWVMTLLSPLLYPVGWVFGRLKEWEERRRKGE